VGKEVRPTIKGKLVLSSAEDKAFLLYVMRNFKDAVDYAHSLLKKGLKENKIIKLLTSRILNNKWYSRSAYIRAKLYSEQPYLKLKKPQLYSVGVKAEKGNRNIRLMSTEIVLIKIPSATGKHRWLKAKVKFGRKHIPIIQELTNSNISYGAGICTKDSKLILYINIPLELYVKYMRKESKTKITEHIAGFDFNPDRINMVIIDRQGIMRDVRNEHFMEITSHGFPREKAVSLRRESLTKLVKYAREHGVKYYVIERLSKPKPKGNKTAKRKISKMALREFTQQMEVLVPKVEGELIKVNPAYSSISAKIIAGDLGLDVHTTSAYIVAMRGLKKIQKAAV
jgi:IS605 OrfB family transposase